MENPVAAVTAGLPRTLRWAVWLLGLEAAVVVLAAGYLLYAGLTSESEALAAVLALPAYVLVMGAALAGVCAALAHRRPRARAPAIVLQLLGVVVAYFFTTAGLVWLSVPVAGVALLVITLLLTPGTNQALTD